MHLELLFICVLVVLVGLGVNAFVSLRPYPEEDSSLDLDHINRLAADAAQHEEFVI